MSIRTWHPEPVATKGTVTRPERAPERAPLKPPEPDKALEGKHVKAHLVTGEVITGTLRRTGTYLLLLETSQGAEISLYKHGVLYLEKA